MGRPELLSLTVKVVNVKRLRGRVECACRDLHCDVACGLLQYGTQPPHVFLLRINDE